MTSPAGSEASELVSRSAATVGASGSALKAQDSIFARVGGARGGEER